MSHVVSLGCPVSLGTPDFAQTTNLELQAVAEPVQAIACRFLQSWRNLRHFNNRHNTVFARRTSGKVKAIKIHHLGPRRREVVHELLLRVGAGIDFREGAQLRVRTKDQVDAGAGPFELAGLAVAPLVHAVRGSGRVPLRAHVEQVDKEVVRERLGMFGEDAVLRFPEVGIQDAHAADERGHLGSGEPQQLRPIQQ